MSLKCTSLLIINVSGNMKSFCENLFTFVSILAYTTADKTGMGPLDRFQNLGLQFDFHLRDTHLQAKHQEGILHLFPDYQWPQEFKTHCDLLQDSDPTETFLKSHKTVIETKKGLPSAWLKKAYFGTKVFTAFTDARREINSHANCQWIDPTKLPSGTNSSALLLSIRKKIWSSLKAVDLAYQAMRQECKRGRTKFAKKDHTAEIAVKALQYEFVDTYFPSWWLSFVYIGQPVGRDCNPHLKSGIATSTEAYQEIREVSAKVNRRQVDKYSTPSGEATPSSGEPSNKKRKAYELVIKHDRGSDDYGDLMIATIKEQILTLKEIGTDTALVDVALLLMELSSMQENKLNKLRLLARGLDPRMQDKDDEEDHLHF
jgi:hypothetical protein